MAIFCEEFDNSSKILKKIHQRKNLHSQLLHFQCS